MHGCLLQVAHRLAETLDQKALGLIICRIAVELTGADKAVVYGRDATFSILHPLATSVGEADLVTPVVLEGDAEQKKRPFSLTLILTQM